jgi:hypothetical protein
LKNGENAPNPISFKFHLLFSVVAMVHLDANASSTTTSQEAYTGVVVQPWVAGNVVGTIQLCIDPAACGAPPPSTIAPRTATSGAVWPLSAPIDCDARVLEFVWHSGWGNQIMQLQAALLIGMMTNRTVLVPPVLAHDALAYGSCTVHYICPYPLVVGSRSFALLAFETRAADACSKPHVARAAHVLSSAPVIPSQPLKAAAAMVHILQHICGARHAKSTVPKEMVGAMVRVQWISWTFRCCNALLQLCRGWCGTISARSEHFRGATPTICARMGISGACTYRVWCLFRACPPPPPLYALRIGNFGWGGNNNIGTC